MKPSAKARAFSRSSCGDAAGPRDDDADEVDSDSIGLKVKQSFLIDLGAGSWNERVGQVSLLCLLTLLA